MIEIKDKQIIIDGKPVIIMCGEIHYYRLERSEWQDRIDKLKQAGCNAVASYIPWLCHEPEEGSIDLRGKTRKELDLAAYIDLCQKNDLYFVARPGPFIMAEMKNEGIPHWVYEKHPDIVPVGWDGRKAPTPTLDYLAPQFLEEVRKWYSAVMEIISPRLHHHGGNIIALQLDNEIGMLSWVSNTPDLTEYVINDFQQWLGRRYSILQQRERYPFKPGSEGEAAAIRSPKEQYAAELHQDLGHYMRGRFARYVQVLRQYAEEFGATNVPFIVNIHGTGAGRGFTFPIGISQLYESYTQDAGYLSGSDIYFGDLNMETFQDLYLINGFMDAVHRPDQPLTSVEFNCGDGNFGENLSGRYDPSAADFKARMCIAQGNRLLNYYLFAGGRNYRMDKRRGDGNDRIASTGERHGFAAPVNPEGELNYTYPRMARSIQTIMAVSEKLATMQEEKDAVAFGFIPDYYMTEYRYPKSERMQKIFSNLEANRAHGAWEIMARALLLGGYRFGAYDIQNKRLDRTTTPVLALPSARYMSSAIQKKLANYVEEGGGLLLYGEAPTFDMEGKPCSILLDALGIEAKGIERSSAENDLSVTAHGWAAPRPEIRTHFAQKYSIKGEGQPLLSVYGTKDICALETEHGKGRAIIVGAAYRCDITLFKTAIERLGAKANLTHDCPEHGLFMTTTANKQGERFLHVLNLDGFDKEFTVYEKGHPLLTLGIKQRDAVMLPLNMTFGEITIRHSTAEIVKVEDEKLTFRIANRQEEIVLETKHTFKEHPTYRIEREGAHCYRIMTKPEATLAGELRLDFTR